MRVCRDRASENGLVARSRVLVNDVVLGFCHGVGFVRAQLLRTSVRRRPHRTIRKRNCVDASTWFLVVTKRAIALELDLVVQSASTLRFRMEHALLQHVWAWIGTDPASACAVLMPLAMSQLLLWWWLALPQSKLSTLALSLVALSLVEMPLLLRGRPRPCRSRPPACVPLWNRVWVSTVWSQVTVGVATDSWCRFRQLVVTNLHTLIATALSWTFPEDFLFCLGRVFDFSILREHCVFLILSGGWCNGVVPCTRLVCDTLLCANQVWCGPH